MKTRLTTTAIAFGLGLALSSQAQPLINEIRIDQSGTDNDEYFELIGSPGSSLGSYTYLVIGDGTGGSGVIESVTSLSGHVLNASGFFLVTETTFTLGTPDLTVGATGLNFENSDNVTHLLVDGFTGANAQDLDTNDDGVLDVLPWTSIVDAVSLVTAAASEFYYAGTLGFSDVGPDGAFVPGHVYRSPLNQAWQIGNFDILLGVDTPGAANPVPEPSVYALLLGGLTLGVVLYRRRRV